MSGCSEVRPTATHEDSKGHETPEITLSCVPTLGLDTTDHEAPFHCSIRVWDEPPALWASPTATHADTEVHETPNRVLLVKGPDAALALGMIDQLLPSH